MAINIKEYPKVKEVSKHTTSKPTKSSLQELLNKDIQLFGSSLGMKQRESLYADLEVLLSSGLDIQRALQLMENSRKKKEKEILGKVRETIVGGASFSESLNKSGQFSDYEIFSIQIGEESGQLLPVLRELSDFYNKSIKYRQQLISALSYPVFVIGFAFFVIYFLLKYLVPLFSDVYNKFDGELPVITQKIVALSNWIGNYSGYLFIGAAVVLGLLYLQRKQTWFRKLSTSLLLRVPIFGPIVRHIYLSRFCQSMYLLLNARVPLLKALDLVSQMISFYPIEHSLTQAQRGVLHGQSLNDTLRTHPFYPPTFLALIEVGEEAGKLELMFHKLAQQYSDAVEQKTAVIGSLLEPILIIGLGVLVGIILVAMYLPLFQMSVGVG